MVERWSSKPFAWVRFLLPLLKKFDKFLIKSKSKYLMLKYKKCKKSNFFFFYNFKNIKNKTLWSHKNTIKFLSEYYFIFKIHF